MRRTGQKLGQHFLNAEWVARDLIASLDIQNGETILEIGPGKGALTKKLLETGSHVIAIEKDLVLVEELKMTFQREIERSELLVVPADVRDFQPEEHGLQTGKYVLAANIPYYITGEIMRQFLETPHQPRAMALLMQKEVAQRIVARDGKESILSISVKAYGTPKLIATVPPGCFNPPPSVDSAILLVHSISKDFFRDMHEEGFFRIVKAGFASKRKMLGGNLANSLGEQAREALAAAGIDEKARAEDVGLQQWVALAAVLRDK